MKNHRQSNLMSNEPSVPFIIVDGHKFFSDRFYLNAPTGLSYFNEPTNSNLDADSNSTSNIDRNDQKSKAPISEPELKTCKCHENEPPPLFDRVKLIQSLDLAAVIIGTYTICTDFLSSELPQLFPTKSESCSVHGSGTTGGSVPTLVLYGKGNSTNPDDQGLGIERKETEMLKRSFDAFRKFEEGKPDERIIPVKNQCKTNDDSDDDDVEIVDIIHSNKKASKRIIRPNKKVSKRTKKRKRSSLFCSSNVDMVALAKKHGTKIFKEPSDSPNANSANKWDVDGEDFPVKSEMNAQLQSQATKNDVCDHPGTQHIYANTTYFTEIQPCYLPAGKYHPSMIEKRIDSITSKIDQDGAICLDDSDSEEEDINCNSKFGIDAEIASHRKNVQGVHHPKFMLLFEKSGSIIVIISTANMTSQKSVDGSWLQRFERCTKNEEGECAGIPSLDQVRDRCDGSDFGYVLSDFLQKQSEAAKLDQILPIQFLRKHVCGQFETIDDVRKKYRFDRASVHLVSTVPGIHPGRFSSHHLRQMPNKSWRILYGPQRVADILARLGESNIQSSCENRNHIAAKPWLPSNILSSKDRFVVQTSSFGSKWISSGVESLVRQYMGHDKHGACDDSEIDFIENLDLIWPTMDFMDNINEHHQKLSNGKGDCSHFVFLSSEGFNNTDLAIASQMKLYEHCTPSPSPMVMTPHMKTYARLLVEDRNPGSTEHNKLAWIMLSSACFSKGAQGFTDKKSCAFEHKDEKRYSNFEIGVLFVSRLQGKKDSDRIYVDYPKTGCSCNKANSVCRKEEIDPRTSFGIYAQAKHIVLPIPFKLQSRPYQSCQDETHFCETPFFHEILKTSIASGLCSLTPFGKWAADHQFP